MKYITLNFQDGAGWIPVSDLVLDDNFITENILFNDDYQATPDTFKMSILFDQNIYDRIRSAIDKIFVKVIDDNEPYFSGYIQPTYELTNDISNGDVGNLELEVLDHSWRLMVPVKDSFSYGNHKISDNINKNNSILHKRLYACGFNDEEINIPDIDIVIERINGEKDEGEEWDIISQLLFEYGYTFYINAAGQFCLYCWNPDIVEYTYTFNDKNIVNRIKHKSKGIEYKGVKINYRNIKTLYDQLLFRYTSSQNEYGEFTGQGIPAGLYYPERGAIEDVWWNYKDEWVEKKYNKQDVDILFTWNHSVYDSYEQGIIRESLTFEIKKARVLYHNSADTTKLLYYCDIRGNVQFKADELDVKAEIIPGGKLKEYDAQYIYEEQYAIKLAGGLKRCIQYSSKTYSFDSTNKVEIGTIARLVDIDNNTDTICIVKRRYRNKTDELWEYELEAITAYSNENVYQQSHNNQPAISQQINSIQNLLAHIPTASELLTGTTKGGWTETPEQPTIEYAVAIGSSAMLRIVKQFNLSNFHHYAIRISKDQLNWFSLSLAGTGADWKDAPGEYTPWPTELFVHTRLPLAGTLADPQPDTYYYQVAVVTKKLDISPWSDVAAVTVSPIQNGDIAANFFIANKVLTGDLETLLVHTSRAIIGYRGTGTYNAPNEGDRMTVLEGDEIRVGEELTGGVFSMLKGIKIGGTIAGLFLGMIGCMGLYHPENPPANIEYLPNHGFHVLTFDDESCKDQYGNDIWGKMNIAYSPISKFGTKSLASANTVSNYSYIYSDDIYKVGDSFAFGMWIMVPNGSSLNTEFFRMRSSTPQANGKNVVEIKIAYNYVSLEVVKNLNHFRVDLNQNIEYDVWYYISVVYDNTTDFIYLTVNNKMTVCDTSSKAWDLEGIWNIGFYTRNGIDNFICFDEISYNTSNNYNPAIFLQHFNHGRPWNTKYSAADVISRCMRGGRIQFDTMLNQECIGLPHMLKEEERPDDWVLKGGDKTEFTIVSFSPYIPFGIKALILEWNVNMTGNSTHPGCVIFVARRFGSQETKIAKLAYFANQHTGLETGKINTTTGQRIVLCDAFGRIQYRRCGELSGNLGQLYLKPVGFYY